MAERGTYRNTRGPSLLGVPTQQGSREGAQLLQNTALAAGSLGNQFKRQQQTHENSLRDKLSTDTVRRARMTFDALAKEHPADPDSFNKKAANYSQGVIDGLRGQFPDIADDLETRLPLMQSEAGDTVTRTYNTIAKSELRANSDIVLADAIGRVESAGPANTEALIQASGDYLKSQTAVGPDNLPVYSPEERTNNILNFRKAVGQSYGHAIINSENDAEQLRNMAETIRGGNFIVNAPYVNPETGRMVVQPQNIRELLGPTGAEALANYAEARISDLNVGTQAASFEQLYAAKTTAAQAEAAYENGSLSPGGFNKWREAAAAMSQTPEELSTNMVKIDAAEIAMPARKRGYVASTQAEIDAIGSTSGAQAQQAAQTAFDQSMKDAAGNPVGYVRKVLSQSGGVPAKDANDAYDKMILSIGSGDLAGAAASYDTFKGAARGLLAIKGFGYDTPLAPSDAQALASRINNIQVAEGVSPSRERAAALRGLQAVFREDTPKVMRQLFPQGIDQNVLAVSQMDIEGASVDLTNALDARGEVNKQLGEAAVTDIRESVRGNKTVSDFVASFPGNGVDFNMALAWQDNVTALAGWYVAQGKSKDEAVNLAVNGVIGANYHMTGSLRIPRANVESEADIAQLTKVGTPLFASTLAESVKDKVAFPTGKEVMSGYVTPDVALEEYKRRLSRGARMVTNADGSGALLVDAQGAPVYVQGAKGGYDLVQFTWAELVARAGSFHAPETATTFNPTTGSFGLGGSS